MKYKEYCPVYVTEDYSIFRSLDGNRDINPLHMKRIKSSMEKMALLSVVTVNENMEVIDGQHSLKAREELGLPVYFIICKGYGREEVNILNANRLNWNSDDFLQAYCDLGYKDYILYREFKDNYGLGHQACMQLLCGWERGVAKRFADGTFKVTKYGESIKIANKLHEIKPYYDGWRRREFINAMAKLIKNPAYNHDEFIEKLKMQRVRLVDCVKTEEYLKLLEDIYNWKRRTPVRLY